ncbi:MAG: methionine biosynthesis protein MetW [Candidatus Goldiibacteriota bacterium]
MRRMRNVENIYREIIDMVDENSQVLDLGCGSGELLYRLEKEKNVRGEGIDISEKMILECIKKGISVIQEDMNQTLENYRNREYDTAVLSQTLQESQRPDYVLKHIVRIARRGVVAFPNFGYIKTRLYILFRGKMPKSKILPYDWHDTPNIHLLTIKDFREFCRKNGILILKEAYLDGKGKKKKYIKGFENLFAQEAVFLVRKR